MDTISNFITIIRNAYSARKDTCEGLYSKMHWSIAQILKNEGYVREVVESTDNNGHKNIKITLKYVNEVPAIQGIERVSTPGRRLYFKSTDIPPTLRGLGVGIFSTSHGVMKDVDCRRQKLGGEFVCKVW